MAQPVPVLLNWGINSISGWGLVGLNIFAQWANVPDLLPLMGAAISEGDLAGVDPLRIHACREAIRRSNAFQDNLRRVYESTRKLPFPVVEGLGNGLFRPDFLFGSRSVARCIFEDTNLEKLDDKLADFDILLCASNWNAKLLRAHSRKPVEVIFESVDPSLFCPAPKSGLLSTSRFYIFSGGKVEFRKGHDLTVIAFREFARRHDDAVLVTLWHSPWPQVSAGFRGRLDAALSLRPNGRIDVTDWLERNGIMGRQVIELGPVPNSMLPAMLREMDCALAPSRAEACTNLLAKEAMACGVPVIIAANTGMLDLISDGDAVPLCRQGEVQGDSRSTDGWGESDPDEILDALETLYTDSQKRMAIGKRGTDWIVAAGRTWSNHAQQLKTLLLS